MERISIKENIGALTAETRTLNQFKNPKSPDSDVATIYAVQFDGTVTQYISSQKAGEIEKGGDERYSASVHDTHAINFVVYQDIEDGKAGAVTLGHWKIIDGVRVMTLTQNVEGTVKAPE